MALLPPALVVACATGEIGTAGDEAPEPEPLDTCDEEGAEAGCYPGDPSTQGIGECRDGIMTCFDGTWSPCEGFTLPEVEICDDSRDNNCDGVVDEGCGCEAGISRPCYTGPPTTRGLGECADGVQQCAGGSWSTTCEGQVLPAEEACDGLDNDCNGLSDDGCDCVDGATQACYEGPSGTENVGVCLGGQQTCINGEWPLDCPGQVLPGTESCNGQDDDCSGAADDGNPGGGLACDSGQLGECAAGTTHCSGGAIQCVPNHTATAEICGNGLDEDCNGVADNGCCGNIAGSATGAINPGGGTIPPYSAASLNNGVGQSCSQWSWLSNSQSSGGWATLTWSSVQTVGSMFIDSEHATSPACGSSGRDIKSATVQYQNPSNAWVTAGTISNAENYMFTFSSPVQAKAVRLNNVLSSAGNGNTIIFEWYVFSTSGCPTPTPN
ncbi:MAG: hypothetical protein JRI68_26745 [Deltaproteobacteria bacterium]|nr:hypothetical protein [Deltaproteobacteria bacterium]